MRGVEQDITNTTIDALMTGLDIAAELHPFIKSMLLSISPFINTDQHPNCCWLVAVTVFKTAYKLQTVRQKNDKRIDALYNEMKMMMAELL